MYVWALRSCSDGLNKNGLFLSFYTPFSTHYTGYSMCLVCFLYYVYHLRLSAGSTLVSIALLNWQAHLAELLTLLRELGFISGTNTGCDQIYHAVSRLDKGNVYVWEKLKILPSSLLLIH